MPDIDNKIWGLVVFGVWAVALVYAVTVKLWYTFKRSELVTRWMTKIRLDWIAIFFAFVGLICVVVSGARESSPVFAVGAISVLFALLFGLLEQIDTTVKNYKKRKSGHESASSSNKR
jgi:hypothetical protein